MYLKTFYRRKLFGVGLSAMIWSWPVSPVNSMQAHEAFHSAAGMTAVTKKREADPASVPAANSSKKPSPKIADRVSLMPDKKISADKITSFFVRANDSKRIQLSILIVHRQEFTRAVRALFSEKVTPLLLSVSTLPNRTGAFDPTLFRFEQRGRIWQPNATANAGDILPTEEGRAFGGTIADGEVQQGVMFLPEWFDARAPITVRYGDFHYLARFIQD